MSEVEEEIQPVAVVDGYGRGVVQFKDEEQAERFAALARRELLGDLRPWERYLRGLNRERAYVVLQDLGSDEQIGLRLHMAATEWSLRELGEVTVHRCFVAPLEHTDVKVRLVNRTAAINEARGI